MDGKVIKAEEGIGGRRSFSSRWFFVVFFVAIFLSVGATYYRIFVARNYAVTLETVCDPAVSACFARDICETEDGVCGEGDTPIETAYYKIVERKASAFPEVCAFGSLEDPTCADLSCRSDEADCTETMCDDETVPEGESCVGPGFVPSNDVEPEEMNESEGDETANEEDASPLEGELPQEGEGSVTEPEKGDMEATKEVNEGIE